MHTQGNPQRIFPAPKLGVIVLQLLRKYARCLLPRQTQIICFLIFFECLTLNNYSALWQEKVKKSGLKQRQFFVFSENR